MQIISAIKTAKSTLQKRRNLFGLGVTSLIAACAGDEAAGTDGTGGGNPAGPIGSIPTENPVPAKLSATRGELAETSIERLAPVTVDSSYIAADNPVSDPVRTGTSGTLNNLVVTIDKASGLLKGDNDFEMTFKNGNHTADPLVSVYQLADAEAGKHDLVVTSADFGYPDGGGKYGGAIYIVWDIKSRDTTTFDDTAGTNFLRILGNHSTPIGNYEPNFLHIGGVDDMDGNAQYDMVVGGGNSGYSYIYIVWDITQYAEVVRYVNGRRDLTISNSRDFDMTTITSHNNVNINIYAPEFFNIGGEARHDMVIRGVGKDGTNDRIYIVWDVADPALNRATINLVNNAGGAKTLDIYARYNRNKIASYEPEFSHIGGNDDGGTQYDMVIRSSEGDKGEIYILWDVAKYSNASGVSGVKSVILKVDNTEPLPAATYGLLKITGAAGENIDKHSPEFLQIGGVVDASNAPQQDMVIRSEGDTDTIYILWDVAAYYSNITIGGAIDQLTFAVDLGSGSIPNGSLKITGEGIGKYSSEFWQIAGTATQEDMVIRSDTAIYVLWDVAAYYDDTTLTTPVTVDLSSTSIANGLLTITGATATDNIGQSAPDILKINNNDDYDMIIKSATDMYVLWDFTKHYSATAPAEISLTDASATNGNGLLTISGAGTANVLKKDDGSFDDIDSNGINDLVFTDGGNTFILFGEQLAYRDVDGKAVSHAVDLAGINGLDFGGSSAGFFTADAVTTVAADAIGYRFAEVKTFDEVKAELPDSSGLSDADAGFAVWDIA